MIRELAKTTVCHALAWARLEAWVDEGAPVVVGYHQVSPDPADGVMPGLAISPAMLARHLDWIGRRCTIVPLDELSASLGRRRPGRPLAAVTFDDGYAGLYQHALPLLVDKGIPATVFVVPGVAGRPLLHDRLYRALGAGWRAYEAARDLLGRVDPDEIARLVDRLEARRDGPPPPRALTWDEVLALRAAGLTIGSHTSTHARLVGLPPARLAEELAGSRRALEERLGEPVRHLAYPDGQFDARVVAAAEEAGYSYAYTICRHRDAARPQLSIPRTMLWERSSLGVAGRFSGAALACQLHGRLALFDDCRRGHA